ncbi:hypothetical protein [Marinoscillum pacificum]|uniref:hypothetical protein n=1 Tax=Marinoscillum pacificum TaxID=392723 RepID=UPI00215892B8|nr:hypothetical protein [Marinoscillum pacificum]
MKKLELLLSAIAVIAFVLFMLLAPKSTIILVLSVLLLSMIYFYLSVALFNGIPTQKAFKKSSYAFLSNSRIVISILTGLALSFTLVGFIFKLLFWPGAEVNLMIGLTGLLIASLTGTTKLFMTRDSFYGNVLKRTVTYGLVAFIIYLLPEFTLLEYRFRDYPDYVEAYKKAIKNPRDMELWDEVDKEREKIEI